MTGVKKSERWWFWVLIVWIFFALGPGAYVANSSATIAGFPVLYLWAIFMWICSIVLIYFVGYKLRFTSVSEDVEEIKEDEQI